MGKKRASQGALRVMEGMCRAGPSAALQGFGKPELLFKKRIRRPAKVSGGVAFPTGWINFFGARGGGEVRG